MTLLISGCRNLIPMENLSNLLATKETLLVHLQDQRDLILIWKGISTLWIQLLKMSRYLMTTLLNLYFFLGDLDQLLGACICQAVYILITLMYSILENTWTKTSVQNI